MTKTAMPEDFPGYKGLGIIIKIWAISKL